MSGVGSTEPLQSGGGGFAAAGAGNMSQHRFTVACLAGDAWGRS